jgi:hypothetical protein
MKNLALSVCLLLVFGILSCHAQKRRLDDAIKIRSSTPAESWVNGKEMHVSVELINTLEVAVNLETTILEFFLHRKKKLPIYWFDFYEEPIGWSIKPNSTNGDYDVELYFQIFEGDSENFITYKHLSLIKIENNHTKKDLGLIKAEKMLRDANGFDSVRGYLQMLEPLQVILNSDKSVKILQNLLRTSQPEGKLYALLGLKSLKCPCLADEAEYLKKTINQGEKALLGNEAPIKRNDVKFIGGSYGLTFEEVIKSIVS